MSSKETASAAPACGLCGEPVAAGTARVEIAANLRRLAPWVKQKKKTAPGLLLLHWRQAGKTTGDSTLHRACYDLVQERARVPVLPAKPLSAVPSDGSRRRAATTKDDPPSKRRKGPEASTQPPLPSALEERIQQHVLSDVERRALMEADDTAEYFDADAEVAAAAMKVAELMRMHQGHVCIYTGAGISTSAGIGDYRGKTGKWTTEATGAAGAADEDDGVPYEELRPTYTHEALTKLVDLGLVQHIITQNCDGLDRLSGTKAPQHLSELHGNVYMEVCQDCGQEYERDFYVLDDEATGPHTEVCAACGLNHFTGRHCTLCDGKLRDTIINFRDMLNAKLELNAESCAKQAHFMLALGSTIAVHPAARLVGLSRKPGFEVAIVNRQLTEFDGKKKLKTRVFGDADDFMRRLMAHILPPADLQLWEEQRPARLKVYDTKRKGVK